jgi:hypothetical protein
VNEQRPKKNRLGKGSLPSTSLVITRYVEACDALRTIEEHAKSAADEHRDLYRVKGPDALAVARMDGLAEGLQRAATMMRAALSKR